MTSIILMLTLFGSEYFSDLPADQESIYTNIDLGLIRYDEVYPEIVWIHDAFWPKVLGCFDDYIFMLNVGGFRSGIIAISTSTLSTIWHSEPGFQDDYLVSVRGDTLYAVSIGSAAGRHDFYLISLPSGEVLYSFTIPNPATSAPIALNDTIILALSDGRIVALRGNDVIWGYCLSSCSPGQMVLVDSTLLFGTYSTHYEFRCSRYWEYEKYMIVDCSIDQPMFFALDPGTGSQIWRTPIPDHVTGILYSLDGIIYASLDDGSIIALDLDNGECLWQAFDCVLENGRFAVNKDYLVCSNDTETSSIDPSSGQKIWSCDIASGNGAVGIYEDMFFVIEYGTLTALDANTGRRLWNVWINFGGGNILVNENQIYTSSRDYVFCIEMKDIH